MSEIFQIFFHYFNAMWKRRWVVLLCAWIVVIPGWMVVASLPSVYQSASRIYVDTSSVLQPLLRGIAVQSDLPSQVQLMKQTLLSRPNLMEVARKTDYDLTAHTDAQMQAMLNSLESRTTVSSNRQDIFAITFEDTDPQRARDVVQALLTIFVESNLGQAREDLDTAEQFLERQIADYEKRLREAEDRLARFKQENMDVTLGSGSYLERARAATERRVKLEQDLAVAVSQRDLLQRELSRVPETVPTDPISSGPPDSTEFQIVQLQAKLNELKSQYTDKHPDVVAIKRQLDALLAKQEESRKVLAESEGPGTEVAAYGAPNPVYSQLKLQLVQFETQVADLRYRVSDARKEADALAAKAESVPQVEAEFQRLNRDYDIIKAKHDELLQRRESARISRSRDAVGQEVQYRMIEPPIVPTKPTGPNRPLFLTAVLGFAIVAGLGMAFLLVLLDTSFASVAKLREYTGLPVLGSVTDTRVNLTSRFAGTVALGIGFIGLFLVFGLLLVVERQYGLDTIVSANLGSDFIERGTSLVVQKASALFHWLLGIVTP